MHAKKLEALRASKPDYSKVSDKLPAKNAEAEAPKKAEKPAK